MSSIAPHRLFQPLLPRLGLTGGRQALACAVAALAFVLPFLNPVHIVPIPAFYEEWLAFVLVLLLAWVLVPSVASAGIAVPRIALGIGALALVLVVQLALARHVAPEHLRVGLAYLLAALFAAVAGAQLRPQQNGAGWVLIAAAVVIGAYLNAFAAGMQLAVGAAWSERFYYVLAPLTTGRPGGNILQSNLLAGQLVIGVLAILALAVQWRRSFVLALIVAVPLLIGIALTGSRMSLLMFAAAAVFAWVASRNAGPSSKTLRGVAGATVAALVVLVAIDAAMAALGIGTAESSVLRRLQGGGALDDGAQTGNGMRPELWSAAWKIFLANPLLGSGFGTFAWEFYRLTIESGRSLPMGGATHAHNVVLHMLAETGVTGAAILVIALTGWWLRVWRSVNDPGAWLLAAIVLVLCVHSMLEFPLWYAPVLLPCAFCLGSLDPRQYRSKPGRDKAVLLGVVAAFGLVTAVSTLRARHEMLVLMQGVQSDHIQVPRASDEQIAAMERLRQTLFRPWIDALLLDAPVRPMPQLLDQIGFTEQAIRMRPFPYAVCRKALLLAALPDPERAAQALIEMNALFAPSVASCVKDIERKGNISQKSLEALRATQLRLAKTT